MITAAQLRAARALASLDQRALAALAGLSVPTIQRMEASEGVIRGNVEIVDEARRGARERRGRAHSRRRRERQRGKGRPLAQPGGQRSIDDRSIGRQPMTIELLLACDAALLLLGAAAVCLRGRPFVTSLIYFGSLALSLVALATALVHIISDASPSAMILPIGLPWIGAHFRLDALVGVLSRRRQSRRAPRRALYAHRLRAPRTRAAAGAAVLSRLSRRHESRARSPTTPTPSWSSWEFMSLASWALVMAHHRGARECARRLRLYRHGELRRRSRCCSPSACWRARRRLCFRRDPRAPAGRAGLGGARACAGAGRRRLEGRPGAAARLAAARPSGRAEPCLGADERRHDQGRRLRLHPHRLRSAGPAGLVVGRCRCSSSAARPARASASCTH